MITHDRRAYIATLQCNGCSEEHSCSLEELEDGVLERLINDHAWVDVDDLFHDQPGHYRTDEHYCPHCWELVKKGRIV